MPLDTTTLQTALATAFLANIPEYKPEQQAQVSDLATAISNAMATFIESATITYTVGLVAPPGGGPVTGVFTNIIS